MQIKRVSGHLCNKAFLKCGLQASLQWTHSVLAYSENQLQREGCHKRKSHFNASQLGNTFKRGNTRQHEAIRMHRLQSKLTKIA